MPRAEKIAKIPRGFHSVTPYLSVTNCDKAIGFYKRAFGAKEIGKRIRVPDGKVMHARIRIGDSIIMMADRFGGSSSQFNPVTLHVYVKDVDRVWKRALAAGAKVQMPLGDTFWGERYGNLKDPFGQRWSIATPIKMSKQEMEAKRKEAMAMFK